MARYAYPLIELHRQAALRQAILDVLPEADYYELVDGIRDVYLGITRTGDIAGYAFVGEGGGYQGAIRVMIGVSPDWESLRGVTALSNVETPGLGAKIGDTVFLGQFDNMPLQFPIEYVLNKPPQKSNQIQAITGATISSRAFVHIVNKSIQDMAVIYGKDTQ
jgi:electron transport complex protein RnfG